MPPLLISTLAFEARGSDKKALDDAARKAILSELGAKVSEVYVFPDKARLIVERLNAREQSGAYRAAKDLSGFASMLTDDLRHPTRDKHLGVRYRATPIPADANRPNRHPR